MQTDNQKIRTENRTFGDETVILTVHFKIWYDHEYFPPPVSQDNDFIAILI